MNKTYSISFISNACGVRPHTIRTWEKRYKTFSRKVLKKLPDVIVDGIKLPRLLTRIDVSCCLEGPKSIFVNELEFVPSLYIEENTPGKPIDQQLGDKIVDALEKKLKLSVIRQILADSGAREFDGLFKVLYDNVRKYTNREGEAILIIAKYQYEYTFVLEKEICIAAMLNKLLDIC